jgi:predicted kinase
MNNKLIIMRGLPGSGKTRKAKEIAAITGALICSADDFFVGPDGVYRYDRTKQGLAHVVCQRTCEYWMQKCFSPVIVDNTNTKKSAFQPYVSLAERYGYEVEFVEIKCETRIAAARNQHGVPVDVVEKMAMEWEQV